MFTKTDKPIEQQNPRQLRKTIEKAAAVLDELPDTKSMTPAERGAAHLLVHGAIAEAQEAKKRLAAREYADKWRRHVELGAKVVAMGTIEAQRQRAEAAEADRLERRRELDERKAKEREKKREENVAKGLVYQPRGGWNPDALAAVFSSELLWRFTASRDEHGRSIAPVLDAEDLTHLFWALGLLSENANEPVTIVGAERARPHWPADASFRRNCLEHLAKNALIEFERQGQVWTFALGERVKGMLGE